ncbi:type VII secretion protein EccCa [Micrococcus luteus]|uniref:type VII secretion protein EccCa n=1 Tax=Micrococcus luteus TaxID=1270 RepID=UPI0037B21B14
MTRRLVHRPGRTAAPERELPAELIIGPQPVDPAADQSSGPNLLMIVPMVAAAASMLAMMAFRKSPFAAVGALAMVVTMTAMLTIYASQAGKARRRRATLRETYTRYLDRTRRRLIAEDAAARRVAAAAAPPPGALLDVVRRPDRLWDRRRADEDFLHTRVGVGARPVRSVRVSIQETATQVQDEFMLQQAEALAERFRATEDMPVSLPLDSLGNLAVAGPREFGLTAARSLVLGACAQQAPEDLVVALLVPPERRADWAWFDRLPHALVTDPASPTGVRPLVAAHPDDLLRMLRADLSRRAGIAAETLRAASRTGRAAPELSRLLVIVDSFGERAAGLPIEGSHLPLSARGITLVTLVQDRLDEPTDVRLRLSATGETGVTGAPGFRLDDYREDRGRPAVSHGRLDDFDDATARGLATYLTPLRLSTDSLEHADDDRSSTQTFLQMLGLSPELTMEEIRRRWRPPEQADFLRVPIGEDDHGGAVHLDLKEAAQLGMGPHGLCVGATGSGKSELLRALVFALLASHAPERLALLLVDFKGGATFAPFEGAPHVTGIITNLSDDLSLVERVYASLSGEILRRQEVLKAAGNVANITDYEAHRERELAQGRSVEPLPHLIVIIDEFGELLTARPDFIDLFLSIGRIGRSIGVHLLLSSQRIESGRLRGLETYLSYRLGLRTLSESESRTVLDTSDAFHLPPLPGFGFLKVDTTVYTRFRSGYVSSPLEDEATARDLQERSRAGTDDVAPVLPVPAYGLELAAPEAAAPVELAPGRAGPGPDEGPVEHRPTIMETLMDRLRDVPSPLEPLWLPPLPEALTLDRAAGDVVATDHGLRLPGVGLLTVPIGLLDDPGKQWQGVWTLDFTAGSGHLIVQGGPRSGKSTLLQTIVTSLALTHSPQQVGVYCVDLLGSSLLPLQGLPHVGGVAIRTNKEMVTRTLRELSAMLTLRERLFETEGIDSMATLRRRHADGSLPQLASADIFLVLDGYGQVNEEFPELTPVLNGLLARGAAYGIHVLTTVSRQGEIRSTQQTYFSHRVELRLAAPTDSVIDRKAAEEVRADTPGRGLSATGLHGQVALPRVDGEADPATVTEAIADTVRRIAESARGRAMAVRVLPAVAERPPLAELAHPERLPLGLLEDDLSVRSLDIDGRERHLVAFGDAQTGRSSMLRQFARHFLDTHTDTEMMFVVFDPRGELKGVIPDRYVAGYAGNSSVAGPLGLALVKELQKRQSGDPADDSPMRRARIVVLVDDYDVLTVAGDSPLAPLMPYLPMAAELRLNVFLTRRMKGASRGLYERFMAALLAQDAATLLFSGDRSEGVLVDGLRPQRLPAGRAVLIGAPRRHEMVQTFVGPAAEGAEEA